MSKLKHNIYGGNLVQNVVSKTCKTLNLIDYDEGFNSLDNEIYIKYIRLVILKFCSMFSNPNSELYNLITCDHLNNIHDFIGEIDNESKRAILETFFNKDIENQPIDCGPNMDISGDKNNEGIGSDDESEIKGGAEDLPTTKIPIKLKDGWIEKENLQGNKYWYNENTRESTNNQPTITKEEPDKESKEEPDKESNEEPDKESNEEPDKESNEEPDKESNEEPDKEETILDKTDMLETQFRSMVGLEKNEKGSKEVALEIMNVLFNKKILDIIKKDDAIVALLATFMNNLYKQTRNYTNKDIVKNMQFCLYPFSRIAYTRHISEKLKVHDEYYKYLLNIIENENHLLFMPIFMNHIEKYVIEINNMIEIDEALKETIIRSLKTKIEIVHKDDENEQRKVINIFIDNMDKIGKLNNKLISILLPEKDVNGGKNTRSKHRKKNKPRKRTKRRNSR
tara:strand:+ start:5216 stop:6574 length:1359 start_codon:yes stop_codon:yes gene_type:complete